LDVEAKNFIQKQIVDYLGTVIIISHDQEFLNDVTTDTILLDAVKKITRLLPWKL
jgi:ATP-binding cassette subfamily F protein uup